MPSPSPLAPRTGPLLVAAALLLLLGLTFPPLSTTRIQTWPWAVLTACFWLLPLSIALARLAMDRPHARFGHRIDAGFGLLAATGIIACLASPLSAVLLPHLLPFLGALALPYALLPLLQPGPAARLHLVGFIRATLLLILLASLLPWLASFAWPLPRNSHPFGHVNHTGSVAVLIAFWFAHDALRAAGRTRWLALAGAAFAVVTVLSTGGRGAVLALAFAAFLAAALLFMRSGRLALFFLVGLGIAGLAFTASPRLREVASPSGWSQLAKESNDQRLSMILGGLRLGHQRPLLGWGPGAVPHAFPGVRAGLPGEADNFLQLHNTPVQLYATLGLPGLIGVFLLALGLGARAWRLPLNPQTALLTAGLLGSVATLAFDHPFATPAFATLAALLLVTWLGPQLALPTHRASRPLGLLGLALLLALLWPVCRDLAARSAYARALDHAEQNDPAGFTSHLQRASSLAPADPYFLLQLASHFATNHPFPPASSPPDPDAAIPLLQAALAANPRLDAAAYNLGWLLLTSDPAAASTHLASAARLAPRRTGNYLGLGLARLRQNLPAQAASAFAAEILLDPTFAWNPVWHDPELAPHRPAVIQAASAFLDSLDHPSGLQRLLLAAPGEPAPLASVHRRVRTGLGVLLGHPEGPPPADVPLFQNPLWSDELPAILPARGFLPDALLLRCADLP